MEGKSVGSDMIPMSRRSREQRASKNSKSVLEPSANPVDIPSTSKNLKSGVLNSVGTSRTSKNSRARAGGLTESSRPSKKANVGATFTGDTGLERSVNASEVDAKGASTITPASKSPKSLLSSTSVNLTNQHLKSRGVSEAVSPGQSHLVNCNGAETLPAADGSRDVPQTRMGRALRPRHVTPLKKVIKRPRPFQEVVLSDSDGPRILGRRIKVFWPLDSKWYYGEVKAYNNAKKQHKIIYDDRDEEWLKLQREQFKLQVLEGEVFGPPLSVLATHSTPLKNDARKSASASTKHSKGEVGGDDGPAIPQVEHLPGTHISACEVGRLTSGPLDQAKLLGVDDDGRMTELITEGEPESVAAGEVLEASDTALAAENLTVVADVPESPQKVAPLENITCESESQAVGALENGPKIQLEDVLENGDGSLSNEGHSSTHFGVVNEGKPVLVDHVELPCEAELVCKSSGEESKEVEVEEKADCLAEEDVSVETPAEAGGHRCAVVMSVDTETVSASLPGHSKRETPASDTHLSPLFLREGVCDGKSASGRLGNKLDDEVFLVSELPPVVGDIEVSTPGTALGEVCIGEIGGISEAAPIQRVVSGMDESMAVDASEPIIRDSNNLNEVVEVASNERQLFLGEGENGVPELHEPSEDSRDGLAESHSQGPIYSRACLFLGDVACRGYNRKVMLQTRMVASEHCDLNTCVEDMSFHQVRPPCLMWLIRESRLITKHIATNLVDVFCLVPWKHYKSLRSVSNDIWRGVPRLKLSTYLEFGKDGSGSRVRRAVLTTTQKEDVPYMGTSPNNIVSIGGDDTDNYVNPSHITLSCTMSGTGAGEEVEEETSALPWDGSFVKKSEAEPDCEYQSATQDSVVDFHLKPVFDEKWRLMKSCGEVPAATRDLESTPGPPSRCLDILDLDLTGREENNENGERPALDLVNGMFSCESEMPVQESNVELTTLTKTHSRSLKYAKRGFRQFAGDLVEGDSSGGEGKTHERSSSDLVDIPMSPAKRPKVQIESPSTVMTAENGGRGLLPMVDWDMNGDRGSRIPDGRDCDSALPRVNVLKLRRCPTNKGLWRVAGNSYAPERGTRPSGDSAEPLTPSSISDRKRSFGHCSESLQPESPDDNGNSAAIPSDSCPRDHKEIMVPEVQVVSLEVKDIWPNCDVSSMQDVISDSRKRRRNDSSSSTSSDDADAPFSRVEEADQRGTVIEHSFYREAEFFCGACSANVLIVQNDRGWREVGATVELQSGHGQGCILAVTVRGESLFAYKAEQSVASGTTNRYTHAMMWKGGKGWSLEFEDRKQWQVFKEMHEECFQRNSKAAAVRQIPIPGVKHIEDFVPKSPGPRFVRPISRYICQEEGEAEMALAKSRVVYDMDSEDELWLTQVNSERVGARGTRSRPLIAEETLERLMDKLEKGVFSEQQGEVELVSADMAAELCHGLASQEVIKAIHTHWSAKRLRKGMALVRHFQPAPWEQYQKQLQAWQQQFTQLQQESPTASKQQLLQRCKRPPLFAFCLRPRGLEARQKLQKQRSQRKQANGSSSRHWVSMGFNEGSLDSPSKRLCCGESTNGSSTGLKRHGRPRLTEEAVAFDLAESFNGLAREANMLRGEEALGEPVHETLADSEMVQRRIRKPKKVGRKARRLRLLAAAQESRRNRLLLQNTSALKVEQPLDVAAAAVAARSTAEAARARAQALYAVADAAMHKAVAAVIAAEALQAAEQRQEVREERTANGGDIVPSFGSWRRAVPNAASRGLSSRGGSSRQGLVSEEDALLPVASWSQELGAGLGTRLLHKGDARFEAYHVEVGMGKG